MPSDTRVSVIVFDVNETLLDLTTLEPLFKRVFGDAAVLREWFAELILYSQAMTLSGLYTPFADLAAGTLRMVGSNHGVGIPDADVAELKAHLGKMPAHPDASPALTRLRAAGFRLATLTNSAPSPSPTPLEKAGIDGFFERHFSVDAVGKFKPDPATYRLVAEQMEVALEEICLVACHLWDTIGAQAAGCRGAFITRPHNSLLPADKVPTPDFSASDLGELAEQIIRGMPASRQR